MQTTQSLLVWCPLPAMGTCEWCRPKLAPKDLYVKFLRADSGNSSDCPRATSCGASREGSGRRLCPLICVNLKKCTTWALWVKFYLGQNEDRSPGISTSLQIALRNWFKEAGGKVIIYVILVKGEYMQSSTCFSGRFLLVSWSFC